MQGSDRARAPEAERGPVAAGAGRSVAGNGSSAVREAQGFTKTYGAVTAVDELSFALRSGEVMGFVGPNGSRKSTTVRMNLGLDRPTRGTVVIDGRELKGQPGLVARNIGAIIENPAFHTFLSGRDNLRALAKQSGADGDNASTAGGLAVSALVLGGWIIAFVAISLRVFERRDVTSGWRAVTPRAGSARPRLAWGAPRSRRAGWWSTPRRRPQTARRPARASSTRERSGARSPRRGTRRPRRSARSR
jgi:hypothetical protein